MSRCRELRDVRRGSAPSVARLNTHDLRHSLAANAFDMKLTLPEVSRLLRHANPNVTATVYASMAGNAVETLQDRLSGLSVGVGGAS
jgi:integrase